MELARREPWTLLDARWVEGNAPTADAAPGEGDLLGFGVRFPHAFAPVKAPPLALRASPRGDDLLFALALAALDGEPFEQVPSLLALSMSSYDLILHIFGPDSWEALDELLRLDASLGLFFAALDARFGPSGWSVVLSADHGSTPLPETADSPRARPWCASGKPDRWERPCGRAERIEPDQLLVALTEAAEGQAGKGDWVMSVIEPYVTLTPAARALPEDEREALLRALIARAETYPGVARAFLARSLRPSCPPLVDESLSALVCRAIPEGAGDLYLVSRPGSAIDTQYVRGAGTNHGSPYLFDRTVPILVRAPGRAAAGAVIDRPISTLSFPRTLSSLLGLAAPPAIAAETDLAPPR